MAQIVSLPLEQKELRAMQYYLLPISPAKLHQGPSSVHKIDVHLHQKILLIQYRLLGKEAFRALKQCLRFAALMPWELEENLMCQSLRHVLWDLVPRQSAMIHHAFPWEAAILPHC